MTSMMYILLLMILSNSTMMLFLSLISFTLMVSLFASTYLISAWSSALLFMSLVGGLLILFSILISSSQNVNTITIMVMAPPITMIPIFSSNIFSPTHKSTSNMFTHSVMPILLNLLILNLTLSLMSKILMNPSSPMKSSHF